MVLTIGFVIGIEAINAVDYYNKNVEDASTLRSEILDERIHTSIEITNVTYGSGNFTLSVDNTGSTTLDPDYVYLATNVSWIHKDAFSHGMSGYWDPEETLNLTYKASNESLVFKVIVENGIMDVYDYVV